MVVILTPIVLMVVGIPGICLFVMIIFLKQQRLVACVLLHLRLNFGNFPRRKKDKNGVFSSPVR